MRVLDRISDAVGRDSEPVVVFDLDSTLFTTQPRNLAILREFMEHPHSTSAFNEIASLLEAEHLGWNIMDDMKQRGFGDGEVLDRLAAFWKERFFGDSYLAHDLPLGGAAHFVGQCHDAGALVYYLTGRDEPNMLAGTRQSLRNHGFPLDVERTLLRLKPHFELPDLEFKQDVMRELDSHGEVVALFENEPANANAFAAHFPDADVLFLETIHSPGAPDLHPRIHRLTDFTL